MHQIPITEATLRKALAALVEKRERVAETYSPSAFAQRAHLTMAIREIAEKQGVDVPASPKTTT